MVTRVIRNEDICFSPWMGCGLGVALQHAQMHCQQTQIWTLLRYYLVLLIYSLMGISSARSKMSSPSTDYCVWQNRLEVVQGPCQPICVFHLQHCDYTMKFPLGGTSSLFPLPTECSTGSRAGKSGAFWRKPSQMDCLQDSCLQELPELRLPWPWTAGEAHPMTAYSTAASDVCLFKHLYACLLGFFTILNALDN